MQVGFDKVHKLTFLSSPPVAAILLHFLPIEQDVTFDPWAINSSIEKKRKQLIQIHLINRFINN